MNQHHHRHHHQYHKHRHEYHRHRDHYRHKRDGVKFEMRDIYHGTAELIQAARDEERRDMNLLTGPRIQEAVESVEEDNDSKAATERTHALLSGTVFNRAAAPHKTTHRTREEELVQATADTDAVNHVLLLTKLAVQKDHSKRKEALQKDADQLSAAGVVVDFEVAAKLAAAQVAADQDVTAMALRSHILVNVQQKESLLNEWKNVKNKAPHGTTVAARETYFQWALSTVAKVAPEYANKIAKDIVVRAKKAGTYNMLQVKQKVPTASQQLIKSGSARIIFA